MIRLSREARKLYEAITHELDEAGAAYELVPGGRHHKLRISHNGRRWAMPICHSPSDWRASRNDVAMVKRALRTTSH
jgi:hypothetical protein